MYFPGDPLLALDPIYQSITDPAARGAAGRGLRPRPDPARVGHRLPLGRRADRRATPRRWSGRTTMPDARPRRPARPSARSSTTPCRTPGGRDLVPPATPGAVRLHGTVLRRRRRPGPGRARSRSARPTPTARCRGSRARSSAARRLHRLGPRRHRRRRALLVHHGRARGGRRRRRGLLLAGRVRPRSARPAVHPRLPAGAGARRRPVPRRAGAGPRGRRWWRVRDDDGGLRFDVRLQGAGRDGVPLLPRARAR